MIEEYGNDYFDKAVDKLIEKLGIEDNVDYYDYYFRSKKNEELERCIYKIARQLMVSVKFKISYLSRDPKKKESKQFRSSGLVETDNEGRGSSGIIAQVIIPNYLPLYGDPILSDTTIEIIVSEDCKYEPDTFISIMAHEMSHVLLELLRDPERHNEKYVDLVPMIMGFSEIVKYGRKNKGVEYNTTYGYLNDVQFDFVFKKVSDILNKYKCEISIIKKMVVQAKGKIRRLNNNQCLFENLLKEIDEHGRKKINNKDGKKIVEFHSSNYLNHYYRRIENAEIFIKEVEKYCNKTSHYTSNTGEIIKNHKKKMDLLIDELEERYEEISISIWILRKNLCLEYKIKNNINTLFKHK